MLRVFMEISICLLVTYGLFSLAAGIIRSVRFKKKSAGSKLKLILVVKNQEETIEGIIRNMFEDDMLDRIMADEKIEVIDLGSTDSTFDILTRLKRYYGILDVYRVEDKEQILNTIRE